MSDDPHIKNLRLCLKIDAWASIIIVIVWALLQCYFCFREGRLHISGWHYLPLLPIIYWMLRVKLKSAKHKDKG